MAPALVADDAPGGGDRDRDDGARQPDGHLPRPGLDPGSWLGDRLGSEQYNDFRDYIEKAETKALGRALAALGFGTQFTDDLALREEQGEQPGERPPAPRQPRTPAPRPAPSGGSQTATNRPHERNGRDPVATWMRNVHNAQTPRALEIVIASLNDNGLRDHPQLAPLIEARRAALAGAGAR